MSWWRRLIMSESERKCANITLLSKLAKIQVNEVRQSFLLLDEKVKELKVEIEKIETQIKRADDELARLYQEHVDSMQVTRYFEYIEKLEHVRSALRYRLSESLAERKKSSDLLIENMTQENAFKNVSAQYSERVELEQTQYQEREIADLAQKRDSLC